MTRTVHFSEAHAAGPYELTKDRDHESSRVLAKDGRWIVPIEERPACWERILMADSSATPATRKS